MAISNRRGAILLSTGNKSELAVGYCTLYGDMCGGLALISDVPKLLVYRLARYVNRKRHHHPGIHAHEAAERRAQTGPEGQRLAAAVRDARSRSWPPTSNAIWMPRPSQAGLRSELWSPTSSAASTAANTSAVRRRRDQDLVQGVWRGAAISDRGGVSVLARFGVCPRLRSGTDPETMAWDSVLGLEASVEVRTFRPARLDEMDDLESPSLQAEFTDSPSNLRGDQKDRFRPKKTSTDANARTYDFGQSGDRQLAPQFGFRA